MADEELAAEYHALLDEHHQLEVAHRIFRDHPRDREGHLNHFDKLRAHGERSGAYQWSVFLRLTP